MLFVRLFVGWMIGWLSGVMPLTLALAATDPTLPTAVHSSLLTVQTVDGTSYSATCATLQAQIDAAAAANVNLTHQITLATGTKCTGPYVLRSHLGGTGWINIRGANFASLPAQGTRVTVAADASAMPQIQYGEDGNVAHVGCFSAATGAQRYRIIGIDCVENTAKAPNWAFIQLGYTNAYATNTGYLVLDRMIIRNRAWASGTYARRGVYGEADLGQTAIIDSIIDGIADTSAESQAWVSINNPGPILLQNTAIIASGENFMFCGGTPSSTFTDAGINTGADTLAIGGPAVNFVVGTEVQFNLADGSSTMPGGITASTHYFIVYVSTTSGVTTVKLSDTYAHAIAGTNLINITSTGLDTDPTGIGSPQPCAGGICRFSMANPLLMPKDITVKWNTMSKDPAWFGTSGGYTVKTMGEMKCGVRAQIVANEFKDTPYNDGGFFHRLTTRNDSYTANASTFLEVSDLLIEHNTYKNGTNWINMFGSDDGDPCGATPISCNTRHSKRWKISNNLVYGLGKNCDGSNDCGNMTMISTGGGGLTGTNLTPGTRGACTDPSTTCKIEDLQIVHNTIDISGGGTAMLLPITSNGMLTFDYKNNLINTGGDANGIFDRGSGVSIVRGTARLVQAVVSSTFSGNRFAHSGSTTDGFSWSTSTMPTGNNYDSSSSSFLWTSPCTTSGTSNSCSGSYDYTLQAGSPAKNAATDGTDQGVNWTTFNAAQNGGGGSPPDTTPPDVPVNIQIAIQPFMYQLAP